MSVAAGCQGLLGSGCPAIFFLKLPIGFLPVTVALSRFWDLHIPQEWFQKAAEALVRLVGCSSRSQSPTTPEQAGAKNKNCLAKWVIHAGQQASKSAFRGTCIQFSEIWFPRKYHLKKNIFPNSKWAGKFYCFSWPVVVQSLLLI